MPLQNGLRMREPTLISHPLNKGNGACIKTALRSIDGGLVAVIDGDGQHDPAELPALVRQLNTYRSRCGRPIVHKQRRFGPAQRGQSLFSKAGFFPGRTEDPGSHFRFSSLQAQHCGSVSPHVPQWLLVSLDE